MSTPADHYRGPAFQRVMTAARRSLERTGGQLDGKVSITAPTDAEREALIGITGTYRPAGTAKITVPLATLDDAVRRATGIPLATFLAATAGLAQLPNRPQERATREAVRQQLLERAEASPLHAAHAWYRTWLSTVSGDGTLTGLITKQDTSAFTRAVRVLEHLDARPAGTAPLMLPALAETTTGDTKALNHGRGSLPTLVLRALAQAQNARLTAGAEARRELWDAVDVIVDDLASRVLVLNLPAEGKGLGEWLTSAATYGTPFHITLHQLVTLPIAVHQQVVYACENPAVLRRAAGELGPTAPPLICTEGRPSTAFHRLAHAVTEGGGILRYHGDFDWPGIDMTNHLITRHQAEPWHMTAADYETGIAADADHVPLSGKPRPTSWDPHLAEIMQRTNRAVYEEAVADHLLSAWRERSDL